MTDSVPASSQGDDSRPTTPIQREASRAQTYHFQWDLGSRRKGPGSVVSETTESRAGDGPPTRTDVFFEHMDSGSATPSFPTSWSASSQGFNGMFDVSFPQDHAHLPNASDIYCSQQPKNQAESPQVLQSPTTSRQFPRFKTNKAKGF